MKTKKRLTKKRKNKIAIYKTIVILIAITAGAMTIGIVGQRAEKEADASILTLTGAKTAIAEAKEVSVWPEEADKIKKYVMLEFYKAGLDPSKIEQLIGECENPKWDINATHKNNDKHKSVDRGIFMINDYWHKEVSNFCSYDLICSTKEAIRIVKERGWEEWVCGRQLTLK